MNKPEQLLGRLNAIGESLAKRDTALALIGLGSAGVDRDRLDRFSDLDFFAIVKAGYKATYLEDLTWLTAGAPIAYSFMNTSDGYKLLYEDGVFCEFAVFEEAELEHIPFSPGRVVWKATGVAETIAEPKRSGQEMGEDPPTEWLIGEALTNLYVGLLREHRGERLSAMRFIQGYAVDRILVLAGRLQPATGAQQDPFSIERRYERRYPEMISLLPSLLQGYERNQESALAALAFLDRHFELNAAMKMAVVELCGSDSVSNDA
jgi:hypothetical protein